MTWVPLAKRLEDSTFPRVLAGPLLRKVTPTSVTVWLAMRMRATVTLTVTTQDKDGKNVEVVQGQRPSVAIGKNLHIVAVTANKFLPPFSKLSEGVVYCYDLIFDFDDRLHRRMADATNKVDLAYPPWTLPSFSLPPKDLSLLRLFQGSCRKPHAEGGDMLQFVGPLIEQSASNAYARPHQLLLTGDQIYADDVGYAMSMMLMDAGKTLLGWSEEVPIQLSGHAQHLKVENLNPGIRERELSLNGFTSEELEGHLIGLGEFIAMYLFVWSEVLWPRESDQLPTFDEIVEFYKKPDMGILTEAGLEHMYLKNRRDVNHETTRTSDFLRAVKEARRVLANIPSYMIFDDHEVTDDWNMTRKFCRKVYGNELGLRVVQNALVAYSLCQHWGNVPEDFLPLDSFSVVQLPRAGASLIELLDTPQPTNANVFDQKAAEYDRKSPDIRKILAIHDAATVRTREDHAVFHDSTALRYHFTVEGPSHQVIFTDTRTWRSFPKNEADTHLLTRNRQTDQFKEQILDAPDTGNRLLFVVLTTNAPPLQPIRAATRHAFVSNHVQSYPDIYEAWDLPSAAFDRLLVALTSKLPRDASDKHTGPIILLSGDVHHSFATRIIYRASRRFEDDLQPKGAAAVIAQLVCSSLKNQTDDTIRLHRKGYYASPIPWVTQRMIRHVLSEGYVGWNFPTGRKQVVGTGEMPGTNDIPGTEYSIDLTITKGTLDVSTGERLRYYPHDIEVAQAPHYRYRFDYLLPTEQVVPLPVGTIPSLPASSSLEARKEAARNYDKAVKAFRIYNVTSQPKVVGLNNFGEIRLDWSVAESRKVHHLVRWQDPRDHKVKVTTYSVRLDINKPDDKEFPDIKARGER